MGLLGSSSNVMEFLDLGNLDRQSIKSAKWTTISIKDQELNNANPKGSAFIQQTNEILIFGGTNRQTFYFNIQDLITTNAEQNKANKSPNSFFIQKQSCELLNESCFAQDSDFLIKTHGNYMYAVDCNLQNLHVYSIKEKRWNFSRLKDIGVE